MPTNLTLEDVRDSQALFSATHSRREVRVAVADGPERDLGWFDSSHLVDLSLDGQRLLESEVGASDEPQMTIFLRKTDGSPAVRLGVGNPRSQSPDGRWVVVADNRASTFQLLPTGPGQARILPSAPCHDPGFFALRFFAWFPDSARLVSGCAASGMSTWAHDIAGGAPKEFVKGFVPTPKAVSPDGKRILLLDQDEAIHLADLAGGPPRRIDEAEIGSQVIGWTRDGAGLLLYRRDRQRGVIEIFRLDLATRKRIRLRVIGPESPMIGRVARSTATCRARALTVEADVMGGSDPPPSRGHLTYPGRRGGETTPNPSPGIRPVAGGLWLAERDEVRSNAGRL